MPTDITLSCITTRHPLQADPEHHVIPAQPGIQERPLRPESPQRLQAAARGLNTPISLVGVRSAT
jgi:hypothetical protein